MNIWVHTLVKNEERYIWYALMSVIEYVDKIIVWDTGSDDRTVEIIKIIKKYFPDKILFKELGDISIDKFTQARQEMLYETKADWFLVLDGDEIWWDKSIKKVVNIINSKGDSIKSIAVPSYNLVGDIYHYQEEAAGQYSIAGRKGHLSIRAINMKIPGLSSKKPHGTWGWVDEAGRMIQKRDPNKILFIEDSYYMHMTHLPRSNSREYDINVPKRTGWAGTKSISVPPGLKSL